MRGKKPKYFLHFQWGNFQLNIVGRRAILWAFALSSGLIGLTHFGAKVLRLL